MALREIEIRLKVAVPDDADAYTAECLLMEAGRKAVQEGLRQVTQDHETPQECPRCEKKG
jgi:hypothetical protein